MTDADKIRWLMDEVCLATGASSAEVEECMHTSSLAGSHKPVVNRRMGEKNQEIVRLLRIIDRARQALKEASE